MGSEMCIRDSSHTVRLWVSLGAVPGSGPRRDLPGWAADLRAPVRERPQIKRVRHANRRASATGAHAGQYRRRHRSPHLVVIAYCSFLIRSSAASSLDYFNQSASQAFSERFFGWLSFDPGRLWHSPGESPAIGLYRLSDSCYNEVRGKGIKSGTHRVKQTEEQRWLQ